MLNKQKALNNTISLILRDNAAIVNFTILPILTDLHCDMIRIKLWKLGVSNTAWIDSNAFTKAQQSERNDFGSALWLAESELIERQPPRHSTQKRSVNASPISKSVFSEMNRDIEKRFSAFESLFKGELMVREWTLSEAANLPGGDFENSCDESFIPIWKITFVRKIIATATIIRKAPG